MSPAVEQLIIQRLEQQAKLGIRFEAKLDSLAAQSLQRHEAVMGILADHDKRLTVAEVQADALTGDVDKLADITGKHDLARIKKLEDGSSYWARWSITTVAAIVIAAVGAGIALLLRH